MFEGLVQVCSDLCADSFEETQGLWHVSRAECLIQGKLKRAGNLNSVAWLSHGARGYVSTFEFNVLAVEDVVDTLDEAALSCIRNTLKPNNIFLGVFTRKEDVMDGLQSPIVA
jgi:hypothetical protein